MQVVEKFIEFLKKLEKEYEILLGKEYRKEFYFTKDSIGFYLASIPKDKLEKFLQKIYEQGKKDIFKDPWNKEFREMVENYYKE